MKNAKDQNSFYLENEAQSKLSYNGLNRCDWCLSYGDNIETSERYFKKEMLKKGKRISIRLCKICEDKLKDIIEN